MLTRIFLLLLVAGTCCLLARFPVRSRFQGEVAQFTLAIASQDSPSGIYYDRDFDWPSGEAVWIDMPVWAVHVGLLFLAFGSLVLLVKAPLNAAKAVRSEP